jgi:hypothetical protein
LLLALCLLRLPNDAYPPSLDRRQLLLVCLALFLCAFAIRTLTWQDNRLDAWKVQTSVTDRYKESARQLAKGEIKTFLTDVPRLGHPPGYPIVLASIFKTAGESDTALQFLQITVDSGAVVVLFLISLELFSLSVSLVAGFFAALSPQFAYFSVLLLPDSLIVFPILLAIYLVVKSRRGLSWSRLFIAGILIGISCWLRANALLLPLFVGAATALITTKGKRLSAAAAVIVGAILAIAPITIKNAIVFHRFIPLSLGSGQTLLEGLADYDPKGTLNIPNTDLGLSRQEAQWYGRPDYAGQLFGEDGIERDRMRVRRGLKTIAEHPVWFASVMGRRALASTRLDPVPVLQPESPVSPRSEVSRVAWPKWPVDWLTSAEKASQTTIVKDVNPDWFRIEGNNENYGNQLTSQPVEVASYHDYTFIVPSKLEHGRLKIKVLSGNKELGSTIVETDELYKPDNQPNQIIELPFVSANHSQISLVIANNASAQPAMLLGRVELFDIGPSSMTWLRYLRMPLRILQRPFTTAWTIPFVVIGIIILIQRRKLQELMLLMVIPAYYLIVQSALHTERRYVYVVHFFFLVLLSVALCWLGNLLWGMIRKSAPDVR